MAAPTPHFDVRPYEASDENAWLRCRVLAFLGTQYYDDVKPHRTVLPESAVALVAATPTGEIIGILDIEIDGRTATIDTVATHPDHERTGVASAMLDAAFPLLEEADVTTLDAWTREDAAANHWYQRNGFAENIRYLHVYLSEGDVGTDFSTPDGLSSPVTAFVHARIEEEDRVRARFRRVYICRQYVRPVPPH